MLFRTKIKIWDEFIYGGHLQCLGAIAILWTTTLLFKAPLSWDLIVTTYLIFYAIYLYNRLQEISSDGATNPSRTAYFVTNRKNLWYAFFCSIFIAILVLLVKASLYGTIFALTILLFGLLYTLFFKRLTRIVPGFKNFFVACVFSILVFLPFLFRSTDFGIYPPLLPLILFSLWIFYKGLIMQIFLDLKDIKSDKQANLRTIPILLGEKQTFRILPILVLLSIVPLFYFAFSFGGSPQGFLVLGLSGGVSLLAFKLAKQGSYTGYLIESGQFISWPILLLIFFYGISRT